MPPIIFFIFNRPAETSRVFERIREARPEKLLIIADGPRSSRPGEAALCRHTREILDRVDWPCEVLTNFADTNLGCGRRVASGLDWAFEQVEEAIILEDDCLPDPSFFPYCAELLERYRNDERIMMISGNNFQDGASRTPDSYYFSRFAHCWGWATWRQAWRLFDFQMRDWTQRRRTRWLKSVAQNLVLERYWARCFDDVTSGKIDSWGYKWMYCVLIHNGFSIAPDVNLVTNIGFGVKATHTLIADERYVVPSCAMKFPLRHPVAIDVCKQADEFEKVYLRPQFGFTLLPGLRPLFELTRSFLKGTAFWAWLRAVMVRLSAA